jgi:hypothetical protein
MSTKSFERPIIELSHNLVFEKAKLIDNEYKLDIKELDAAEKLEFLTNFLNMNTKLDTYIQEYLNDACQDRMYAESQFGGWDE